ncbi:DUF1501 domain-containing protein [Paenibacillus sp. TRM 82003]|uniref:DUF1501 domain-containing protein n=1 Tax=Kineococcus sp. TRM81007 TaxID=2925831 RepID=UPI001F5A8761|nr:DUF1501 domain-containing protein [Kineococcus sp. TRM81007]MCI2237025.1 DUF1501 domain-containing protein [Kineococcus sp. TRM81007]MCI3919090.1 DUF1501 domain-containing protein [Paenibacillus sp. TRM 82003]
MTDRTDRPADRCSCREGSVAAARVSRRGVLKAALGAAAAGTTAFTVGDVSTQVSYAAPGWTGETLVVLSLHGGFDGLSVVVPGGDPAYYAARPNVAVPASTLLALDGTFGLHPAMAPLLPFWRAGTFGAVQAVGQGSPSRSHFAAMQEMERAAPGTSLRTGWIDRTLGVTGDGGLLNAVQVGVHAPPSFAGPQQETTMQSMGAFALAGPGTDRPLWHAGLRRMHVNAPAVAADPANALLDAMEEVAGYAGADPGPVAGVTYPATALGRSLSQAAALLRSGAPVQMLTVDYGDWDMHANFGHVDRGWMFDKLTELSGALAAFATDLGPKFASTTIMTLSEFGRRVQENASWGLDHGHGNAVLLLGGGVVGGRVHGRWPGLAPERLLDGDLPGTTDYRAIIAEVLQKRLGAGSLSSVFPGLGGDRLGVVRQR